MPKLPYMQFFPNDWLMDTRILTDEEKAIWIDLLCFMWRQTDRGSLTGAVDDIARMIGKDILSFQTALDGIKRKGVCELTKSNDLALKFPVLTIVCRRMTREHKSFIISKDRMNQFVKANNKRHINAKTTAKKSEVRSQKSLKDSIEVAPQASVDKSTDRPLTEIQKVVLVYKMLTGYPKEDAAWDKLNFARCAKSAKALIDFMGNWKDAADCVQDVYERLGAKGFTVSLEGIQKHASEWKKDKREREASRGILPV